MWLVIERKSLVSEYISKYINNFTLNKPSCKLVRRSRAQHTHTKQDVRTHDGQCHLKDSLPSRMRNLYINFILCWQQSPNIENFWSCPALLRFEKDLWVWGGAGTYRTGERGARGGGQLRTSGRGRGRVEKGAEAISLSPILIIGLIVAQLWRVVRMCVCVCVCLQVQDVH